MKNLRNKLFFNAIVLLTATFVGCASSTEISGEPGVSMGDSYQKVLDVVSHNNTVTKQIDGQAFRAEGYSAMFKDCRIKYFLFSNIDGLQRASYEPAPHLLISQNCRQS